MTRKKELLELLKECDDPKYLRQIAITANALAYAVEKVEEAKKIMKYKERGLEHDKKKKENKYMKD